MGSRANQLLGATSTSTDPAVATAFAVQSKNYGDGVVHIALPSDLQGLQIAGNVLEGLEKEVVLNISAPEFAKRATLTITADQSRNILKSMGINVPAQISRNKNISEVLRELPKMTQKQIDKFYTEAVKVAKNGE